ncbi:MAG: amidase family protein [Defluviitaleaceae bacterium]|nr:amidase family protein [Defluviitaleaceae bacterium]
MFTLEECTIKDIRAAFEKGEITSYKLVLSYMERIGKIDSTGAALNSIIELNPDALFIAAAMDRERTLGKIRSPLHGVPILLKDNINTSDKMRTSAGSLALKGNFANYDSTLVKKLRDAGLVIMGKANMTELANFMSYTMESGYSSRGGQVINPYKAGAPVSGSSTGSAVSISANLCAVSIGTETNGSIISPAFANGVVGIKPTVGLVSRYGIIPISTAQDTAGPMARTVADAASLLNIIAGSDEYDPATWCSEDKIPKDYTKFLNPEGLKGLRVGINYFEPKEGPMDPDEEYTKLAEDAIAQIAKCGANIIENSAVPDEIQESMAFRNKFSINVLLYEFQKSLNAYLATTGASNKVRSLKDMIDFYGDHPKEGLKYGMSILQDAQYKASGNLTDAEYIEARLECLRLSKDEGLDKVFKEHNLDILVSTRPSGLAPISGYPAISIPAGYKKDGTPYGITIIGKAFDEPKLIAAAYAYEQASKMRKAPVFNI